MKVNSITLDHDQKIPVAHLFKCVDQTTTQKDKPLQDFRDDETEPETVKMSVQALNRQLSHISSNSDLQITNLIRHKSTPSGIIILIEWNTGESSWTPLKHLCDHDLTRVIEYAEDNNLTNTIGWKWVPRSKRALARQSLKIRRLMSASHDYFSIRRITNHKTPRQVNTMLKYHGAQKMLCALTARTKIVSGKVPYKKNLIPWSHTVPSNEYVKGKFRKTISITHSTSFSTSNQTGLGKHDLLLVDM